MRVDKYRSLIGSIVTYGNTYGFPTYTIIVVDETCGTATFLLNDGEDCESRLWRDEVGVIRDDVLAYVDPDEGEL